MKFMSKQNIPSSNIHHRLHSPSRHCRPIPATRGWISLSLNPLTYLQSACTLGELARSPFAFFFQCRRLKSSGSRESGTGFVSKCRCVKMHLPLVRSGPKHREAVTARELRRSYVPSDRRSLFSPCD